MNRKRFLSSLMPLAAALPLLGQRAPLPVKRSRHSRVTGRPHIPPYLKPGDRIGITCPAGYITPEEIRPAILQMESWGMTIQTGATIGKRDHTFGGTDEERARDFQQMLDSTALQAIMCARGGYGSVRIIDQLDFTGFARHPKWIIGFSDITVLHSHLGQNYGIASVHAKMCNSFPDNWSQAEPIQVATILSIRQALTGEKMIYPVVPNAENRTGVAEGVLVGGNLKTIESLTGSRSDIDTAGKILFVEDTGEYLYSIDRMFWNLKRTGKLSNLKALMVGGFKVKPDDAGEEFGRTVSEIVMEKVREYRYPVCFDFPVGHQRNNYALKCGMVHQLDVRPDAVIFQEA